jgi:hypothetical protein
MIVGRFRDEASDLDQGFSGSLPTSQAGGPIALLLATAAMALRHANSPR